MFAIRSSARFFACLALSFVAPAAMAVSSTVDATGDSGAASSMQINAGKPVIAYTRDGMVMLATCTGGCTTATPAWVIATVGNGGSPSLQLNSGNPVVTYVQGSSVMLATCTAACATATPTWVTAHVQSTGAFYQALGLAGGIPVVVVVDTALQEVNLATCTANCATTSPTWTRSLILKKQPGDMFFVGQASLAMNGNTPWVSYERGFIGGSDLTVATCTTDCASASATWARSSVDIPLQGHALQLRNGLPAVAYHSFPMLDRDLKYAVCTADCDTASATWMKSTVDTAGTTGQGASLQFQAGLPVISFIDGAGKIRIARCTANCTIATPTWAFETVDDGGGQTSLALLGSVALASYYDPVNDDLRYAALLPPEPVLQLSATSLDYGTLSVPTTSRQVVTLTNVGGATLDFGTFTAAPLLGVFPGACTSLAPGTSCSLPVDFRTLPFGGSGDLNAVYPASGSVTISSNATGSPHTIAATATVEKSLVQHYYQSILRRAPDTGGRDFWRSETTRVAGLGANVNEVWFAMAQSFFNSAEYVALNRDNPGYVTDLYRTFFSREPDQGGLDFWVGQRVAGLPREVMLAAFMFSPEFTTFIQGGFGNTAARAEVDAVLDFYRGLLSRLPDDGGLGFWIGRFRAAQCTGNATVVVAEVEAISRAFADSGEYAARGRNNAQFVGDLYNAFLRRGGDLNGVQFWVDQLAAGARTRDQVRLDFKNSAEFQARVNAIVAQGCTPT